MPVPTVLSHTMVFGGAPFSNHTSGAAQLQSYRYPGPLQPQSTRPTVLAYTQVFGGAPMSDHTSGAAQLQSFIFPGPVQPQPGSAASPTHKTLPLLGA